MEAEEELSHKSVCGVQKNIDQFLNLPQVIARKAE